MTGQARLAAATLAALALAPAADAAQETTGSAASAPAAGWLLALVLLALAPVVVLLLRRARQLAARLARETAAAAELDRQRLVEQRLGEVATRLLESGFEAAVDGVLATVGELLDGDRCYLTTVAGDRRGFDVLHEWHSGRPGRAVEAEAPAATGGAATAAARPAVTVPLEDGGEVAGWLGIEAVTRSRTWSQGDLELLQRVAALLATARRLQRDQDGLRRLALAVEQSPATVMITDPNGVIEYVNPRFSEVTGYTAEEAIGSTPQIVKSGQTPREVYADLWHTVTSGGCWRGELVNRKKTGELYWEAMSISPLRSTDGAVSHFICLREDVSERRRTQTELEAAKEEADRANRAKSEFLANISHEIRTPVNAIVGNSHLALQTELTDKQRDYLTKIRASAQTLLSTINDVLDLAEIEAGRLELDTVQFQLDDVLGSVEELLSGKAREKGLELTISCADDVPRALDGDPVRLEQVLVNLVGNAIKFTERGEVRVTTELLREHHERVVLRFSVKDTGIGISPEGLEKLFEPFTQVDGSTTRMFGGAGLGLAISKHLVEMMGGLVGVTSELGVGSDFFFTVALRRHAGRAVEAPASPELKGLKVLVVDDSRTDQKVLCEVLESFSFRATAVDSGQAALRELELSQREVGGRPYDLVLLDWKMPSMDGVEAAGRIKKNPKLQSKPAVILVTGHGREDVLAHADAGFDGFLLKPVNPSLLFDAIVAAVGHEGAAAPGVRQEAAGGGERQLPGARVLLVEDNAINQELAQELLSGMGVTVDVANDGREAVEAVRKVRYDLILMDVQMPVMDGYHATAEIRREPSLRSVPIVAMTAHAMSGDRERCLAAGMDDYLTKPIDTDRLFEVLAKWVKPQQVPVRRVVVVDDGTPLPAQIEGIDLEIGIRRLAGNRRLLRKLLLEFLQDYRGVIDTIRTAIDLGHTESVMRLVHTLKGVAATIGANSVHYAARDLEAGFGKGDSEQYPPLLRNLEKAMAPVITSLTTLERETTSSSGEWPAVAVGTVEPERLRPAVVELLHLLHEGDAEAADRLAPLSRELKAAGLANELDTLRSQLDNFDYEEAERTLRGMAQRLGLDLAGVGS